MFWSKSKNTVVEPYNRFKFVANFSNFAYDSATNPLNSYNSEEKINLAVKKIDLPKMNLEFERAYANEQVHYFQNGSIHWEPINITFIDASSIDPANFSSLRLLFSNYISTLGSTTGVVLLEENRTSILDLPSLCEKIEIISYSRFAKENYPTLNNGTIQQGLSDEKFDENTMKVNESYVIKRPRLSKIDFGSMDYNSDEINEITITVIPEWCNYSYTATA